MAYFQGEMPWRVIGTIDNKKYPVHLSNANNAAREHGEVPLEPYAASQRKNADAVFWCQHQTIYYRLDSGKADEYYMPPVLCVNCRAPMLLIELFGHSQMKDS